MSSLGPVATALPPNHVRQDELIEIAEAFAPGGGTLFSRGRIDARSLAMPVEWYLGPHGFEDRSAVYADVGLELAEAAALDALQAAAIDATDVDAVFFVSTTGIATPSLDARLAARLGCRPDIVRVPVWGLGCAGGVAGVNRAADWLRGRPHAQALVVCMELCSLGFRAPNGTSLGKKETVAASLFGDGCAALVMAGDEAAKAGPGAGVGTHVAGASHLFPGTERVMGWDVRDDRLEVVLDPGIPALVNDQIRGLVDGFLASHAAGRRPDRWVMHPGGAKVVDAYRRALELDDSDLGATDAVLAAHGNMSSPTVLFVLQEALATPLAAGATALLAALGPGFASELALVRG